MSEDGGNCDQLPLGVLLKNYTWTYVITFLLRIYLTL